MIFNPKVSIVIPVYNGSNYLKEAIDSALNQTYDNIEIIVVNDGSDDENRTRNIAMSYGNKIRYFEKENGGVASALNHGIEKMEGEYFSWLSHDDLYYPEKIKTQVEYLSKLDNKNTIMYGSWSLINKKSKLISDVLLHRKYALEDLNKPLFPVLHGLIHGCVLIIPKICFIEIGLFDINYKTTQDYHLWFKMMNKYEIFYHKEILIKSRLHPNQGSKNETIHIEEANELWKGFAALLTDEDINALKKNRLSLYLSISDVLQETHYNKAYEFYNKEIEVLSDQIKVSVIIPFHNRFLWLEESVTSVLMQSHQNLEIILIDDGSTESTDTLKEKFKLDKRIIFLEQEKSGVSKARNKGMLNATGKYIAFCDSDDLFENNKIRTQLFYMEKHNLTFTHTSYKLFADDDENNNEIIHSAKRKVKYPDIIYSCPIATPTIMILREFLVMHKLLFKNVNIGEDICLWIDIAELSSIEGIDEALTKVRYHGLNTAYNTSKMISGLENILQHALNNERHNKNYREIGLLHKNLYNQYLNLSHNEDKIIMFNDDQACNSKATSDNTNKLKEIEGYAKKIISNKLVNYLLIAILYPMVVIIVKLYKFFTKSK